MSEKLINFSDLKRKEIKCIVFESTDGGIIVQNDKDKIKKILEEIENPVIIYNPAQEQKEVIHKLINKSISKNRKEPEITGEEIILELLPLITNIILDLHKDNSEDVILIKEIIDDPSPIFEKTITIIKEIIKNICSNYLSILSDVSQMSKEQKEELFKTNKQPKLSEKELKRIELEKQLAELDKEDKITE